MSLGMFSSQLDARPAESVRSIDINSPKIMWFFILLISACIPNWTTGLGQKGSYFAVISNRTLKSITSVPLKSHPGRMLDLSNLKLRAIESNVFDHLQNLTHLNLTNNDLEKLPPLIFSKLKNLEVLSLANNQINVLDRYFVGLSSLKTLDLSNNSINSLKKADLLGLSKSIRIIVAGNPLKTLITDTSDDPSQPRYMSPKPNGFYVDPWSNLNIYDEKSVIETMKDLGHTWESSRHFTSWMFYDYMPFYLQLCKSTDGFVQSIAIQRETASPGNCLKIDLSSKSVDMDFSRIGLTGVKDTWYQIRMDLFETMDLSWNKIHEITPELLNDLPKSLIYIDLTGNRISVIKKDMIETVFLLKLILDSNGMTTIENGAFAKTKLVSISFKHNLLVDLNFVKTLPISIEELVLDDNRISKLSNTSLANLKSLKNLRMSSNRISRLPIRLFRGLDKLRLIDLSNNLIKTIKRGTFADQRELSVLRLTNNQIRNLRPGMFTGLTMVHTIELQENVIRRIHRDSFMELRQTSIHQLMLSWNKIVAIEKGSFANMTIELLSLSNNQISKKSIAKGAFESCTLNWLSLASNRLTTINGNSFYGILVYNTIALQENNITSIRRGTAKYMGGVRSLDLTKNPIEYIENGSLFGFRRSPYSKIVVDSGLQVIEGGAFD